MDEWKPLINGINIGIVYAQNARAGGGAHWVLKVGRRRLTL